MDVGTIKVCDRDAKWKMVLQSTAPAVAAVSVLQELGPQRPILDQSAGLSWHHNRYFYHFNLLICGASTQRNWSVAYVKNILFLGSRIGR